MNRVVARRDDTLVAQITDSFALHNPAGGFVRAGSGLVAVGGRLLAVQDDALAAVWIDPATRALETVVLGGPGAALAKMEKPDFEAALVRDGTVWILGSGTTPDRRRFARLDLGQAPALLDRAPLYARIEATLGMPPNLEGAVALPDRLRLFHRGPGRRRDANFALDVPLAVLTGGAPRVLDVIALDLGTIEGLHLGVTDAVALGADRILYLAVAEDTPDGIADGPIAGAAIGVLDAAGARWAPLREPDGTPARRKFEGIALDADGAEAWLLTDPDDAARAAELCRVTLAGF